PSCQRRTQRNFFPFRMEGRFLQSIEFAEKGIDETLDLAIALTADGPVIRREDRWHGNSVDALSRRYERWIIVGFQLGRQIIRLQGGAVVDWHQVKTLVLDRGRELGGDPLNGDHCIDFAFTKLFIREALFDVDEVGLDPESLEHSDCGNERS